MAFEGDWKPSNLAQDMWTRGICTSVAPDYESHQQGAKSVTRLENVTWNESQVSQSPVLQQLKQNSAKELSVSITIYFYTRDTPEYLFTNFTLVGTIGVANSDEPKFFNGDRLATLLEQPNLPLNDTDSCYNYSLIDQQDKNHAYWMYKAPFQLFKNNRLTVDFSNSLPLDLDGNLRNLGHLWLGIINEQDNNCIKLISDNPLPYLNRDENWMTKKGGVIDIWLNEGQFVLLNTSKLVVVRGLTTMGQWDQSELKTTVAGYRTDYFECGGERILQIMLQENPFFIRPIDDYVARLEYHENFTVRLLVTEYGKPVRKDTDVVVFLSNNLLLGNELPVKDLEEAVKPKKKNWSTNSEGIVEIEFEVNKKIPFPREYRLAPCGYPNKTLPIDGQVYTFKYYIPNRTCEYDPNNTVTLLTCVNYIAILAFSYEDRSQPYTWVNGVEAIFKQYNHLYPVMHPVVDLSNYTEVIRPHNHNLIMYAMSLPTNHPSYMPVTRDLSPTKRVKILKWLENPIYDDTENQPDIVSAHYQCVTPAAVDTAELFPVPTSCKTGFSFGDAPYEVKEYFKHVFEDHRKLAVEDAPRPLWRFNLNGTKDQCSPSSLKTQLQQAVELEFATLPVYLTSLYSIVDGCNTEVYALIRSIIMEEMLHMTQAANILIALGGTPEIDSNKMVPTFPLKNGLPGGVLPNLTITLKKASLEHIHNVFMGIEVPHNISDDSAQFDIFNNTIGQFYDEIRSCIHNLSMTGNNIFDKSTVKDQVQWPWDAPTGGKVYKIENATSAEAAINEIILQGEGAGPHDPTVGKPGELAHFYKFEEIVCGYHLEENNKTKKYNYTGAKIPFSHSRCLANEGQRQQDWHRTWTQLLH